MVVDVLTRTPAPADAPALASAERTWTYGELSVLVDARVGRLRDEGHRPGDVVPTVVEADAEGVVTLLALWRLGATAAPLHARLTEPEREAARRALEETMAVPGKTPAAQAVLWTSGTAGRPRGVAISFGALAASARAAAERLDLRGDDVWLASLSPAHVGGLALIARAVLLGSGLVAMGPFDAAAVSRLIDAGGVTHVSLVPTQLLRLLDVRGDAPPPASFRCALIGGATAPERLVARALAARWSLALTYGLTEATSQVATAPPDVVRRKPGTVGPPLAGVDVRIAADDEILVRGATLASGYVAGWAAEASRESGRRGAERALEPPVDARGVLEPLVDGDGWHHTGDLGRVDEQGDLWITGRRVDRIVSGGVTVDALEVEEALRAHPGVRDAGVVGLPDEEWGERVGAWVEPVVPLGDRGRTRDDRDATGGAPRSLDLAELDAWLRERLSPAKLPRVWHVAPGLPRNANGKLDRVAVREALAGRSAS